MAKAPGRPKDDAPPLPAGPPACQGVAAAAIIVVGAHQIVEGARLFRTFPVPGINMIDMPARGRHGLSARSSGYDLLSAAAVGIVQNKTRLIDSVFLEVQDRASEHVGRLEVENPFTLVNSL